MRETGTLRTLAASWLLACALFALPGCSHLPFVGSKPAIEANTLPDQPVVLPARRLGNLLLVELQWDKRGPWRFLIDTGSSVTLVSSDFASRYAVSRKRFVNAPKRVRLSTGAERLFPNTVIEEFRLGGASFANKPVLVFDNAELSAQFGTRIDGILGFPFFGECRLELDYAQPQLRIQKSTTADAPPGATPFVLETRTPRVRASIGGYARDLLLDSGSDAALVLPAPVPDMAFSVPPRPGGVLGSLSGASLTQVARLAGDLRVGDSVIPSPVVTFGGTESSVGGELLSQFTVTFDTRTQWVRLTPGSSAPLAPAPFRHCGMSFAKSPAYWRIESVIPGSSAEQAGVRVGDLIVRINGEPVANWPFARFDAHVRRSNELVYTFLHGTRERPIVLIPMDLVP
ncbi:aspartyl protease family protein [Nibricoccus sp. IMCC34717]|uniref:aspartyl protease family protein n=1 Tax=Nibricoccus sp. IMCC34717 TaxID=3034021 RepID=UPI00384B8270